MRGRARSRPISWGLKFSADTVLRASTPPATALLMRRPLLPLLKGSDGMPNILNERRTELQEEHARQQEGPLRAMPMHRGVSDCVKQDLSREGAAMQLCQCII